jgi:hypothetical protein
MLSGVVILQLPYVQFSRGDTVLSSTFKKVNLAEAQRAQRKNLFWAVLSCDCFVFSNHTAKLYGHSRLKTRISQRRKGRREKICCIDPHFYSVKLTSERNPDF